MMSSIRILHVHCRYRETGGEDTVVDAERDLLRAGGFEVVTHDAENPSSPAASATQLLAAPWNPASYKRMRQVARDSGAHIAHVHNTWFALSPSILTALHRSGMPTVATIHNFRVSCVNGLLFRDGRPCTDCVARSPWRGVAHRCYRSSAGASAAVATTISANRALGTWRAHVDRFLVLNDLARRVLTVSGVPEDKVTRTDNFVRDSGPRPHPPSASKRLVFVGRLSHEKGVDLLLEAWRRWRPDEPWSLTIAGDGPLRSALERRADRRVEFLGRIAPDEVTALLQDARALALPSVVFENQPMAALEAFAAGVPVLGRGFGGILRVVAPLGPDWVVNDTTVEAWTQALETVRSPTAVDAAGRVARREYEQHYSVPAATARAHELYTGMLGEREAVGTR